MIDEELVTIASAVGKHNMCILAHFVISMSPLLT